MKVTYQSALLSILLITILIFVGFVVYEFDKMANKIAKLTEQYHDISQRITQMTNETLKNKFVILAWHKKIEFQWSKWIDVSNYTVGFLYYFTEDGSDDASLLLGFHGVPTNIENVFPGTLYSTLNLQIGAGKQGVFKFDIQAPSLFIELYAISTTPYDWIKTSLSLYLVS